MYTSITQNRGFDMPHSSQHNWVINRDNAVRDSQSQEAGIDSGRVGKFYKVTKWLRSSKQLFSNCICDRFMVLAG